LRHESRRYLITENRIVEAQLDCCTPGRVYLMFLRGRGANLGAVRGRWSVLPLEQTAGLPVLN
jgi:hypothetical protein